MMATFLYWHVPCVGMDAIVALLEGGCSPAEALDYYATVEDEWTQIAWADVRGVTQGTVAGNVDQARTKLGEES